MSQFDRIWCLDYDEDSYHRSMVKINFSKYLNTILSNQHYPLFQTQVYQELNDESEWNQRSWALLQMFQYFNGAFAIKQFQSNVKFIADKKTRKMFGSFRMWIDLERLYLLTFLKMDRIQFQEDRIYFCLYRTMFFLFDLLQSYQISDFKIQFLQKISSQITKHTKILEKSIPNYMHNILKCISEMIPNFIRKNALVDPKEKDDIKKSTFRKLSRQYDLMPEILQRLSNNIQFQTKQRQMKQISEIVDSHEIKSLTKEVEELYDPKIRIATALRKECQMLNKPYDQSKFNQLLDHYRQKQKEKIVLEAPYQSIMRAGHNPYDQSNYAIYGETLGVDMDEKENLEKRQQPSEVEEQPVNQNALYYDPAFLSKISKMSNYSAAVTYKDLNNKAFESERDKHYSQDNSILLRNLQWTQQNKNERLDDNSGDDQDDGNGKANPATTLRSINLKKNLQNNTLFQKHDDEEKEKSISILKKAFRRGLESDVLFVLQQRSRRLFSHMDSQRMMSLKTKSIVDRSKFDALRKVAQFHAISKKIKNWVRMDKVPNFYPRGIDQIRRFNTDTTLQKKKTQLAFQAVAE